MGAQLTCGCCAKEGSLIDDRQDSRMFFCRKPCGLDELETDFSCDPAGAFFEDTLLSACLSEMDKVSFSFASSANLAGLRWCFVYGANPTACDSNGTSLLHVAARAGSYQIVKDSCCCLVGNGGMKYPIYIYICTYIYIYVYTFSLLGRLPNSLIPCKPNRQGPGPSLDGRECC